MPPWGRRLRPCAVAIALATLSGSAAPAAGEPEAAGACQLGAAQGLSPQEAAARVERCLSDADADARDADARDAGRDEGEGAGAAAARGGAPADSSRAVERLAQMLPPPAGEATAVVATACPSAFGSPCFAGSASIQDAIDHLTREYPEGVRTVLITPGEYVQSFATRHGWRGETHLVGLGATRLLAQGPVRITAPDDGVASAAWTFGGRGSVKDLSFKMGDDPGDVGIRVTGVILLELYFENISLVGVLRPGSRGFEVSDIFGFLSLHNSSVILPCKSGAKRASGFWVDQGQRQFTEITIHEGHYQVAGFQNGPGCVTFDLERTPYGDDRHGMAVEFVHLQCEFEATCFALSSDDVHLEIGPLVWRRSPSGRFVDVVGGGHGSRVYVHGVTREAGRHPSRWGAVVPRGAMTITGRGEPAMPTFPGWRYVREDGGPNSSVYFGTGAPGPPFTWRPLVTAPEAD